MPGFFRRVLAEVAQSQRSAEVSQRVRFFIGPGGARELESVDPRTKGVAGKRAQESFLGSMTVGHDGAAAQSLFKGGPQRKEGGSVAEVVGGDAVDFLCGPGDVLVTMEKGDERIVNVFGRRPGREPDLDRRVGSPFGGAGRLEVDGSKDGFADLDGAK